jgi:predicted AlkP superfamily phosphohydrolase/phosphomutase/tetratricopeptide (TPR) repeat protein
VTPKKRKILLIGWDSADWKVISPLLDRGLMPALACLVERGVMGNIAAVEPILSPLIWTSIATGKRPHKHGVLGFVEPDPLNGGIRSVGSRTRAGKALWNILSESDLHTHAVNWFASHPAEPINGLCVSERFSLPISPDPHNWPVSEGSVNPASDAATIADLRVHPKEIEGSQIQPFIPRAAELNQSDPKTQERLMAIARILAETATVQSTTTWILENREWDFLAVYFRALDEFGHHFMPFHPPRLAGVDEREAEIFGSVMETAYCFHDLMLGRLLALAGDDTTVILVSDHGFESGALRPGTIANRVETMANWHRPFGILAIAGEGVRRDERIYGASILDVAPTILHLFGLAVGRDMDGKVLVAALESPQKIERRDSWEDETARELPQAIALSVQEEQAMLDQWIALGYIERPEEAGKSMAQSAEQELRFNRITSLLQGCCLEEAESDARALAAHYPGDRRVQLKLVQVLLSAGMLPEARELLDALDREPGPDPVTRRVRANLLCLEGRPEDALASLGELISLDYGRPEPYEQCGRIHLQLRRWAEAESCFRHAIALEADNPHALVGFAAALARQGKHEVALESVLRAVGLQHFLPAGHFQLGAILAKMDAPEKAIQAFEIGLIMEPGNILVHRYLTRLYHRIGNIQRAADHYATSLGLARRLETPVG